MEQPTDPSRRRSGVDWAKVASVLTAIAAIAALYFTNRSLQATVDQLGLTEQSQTADRFGKAVDQIASDRLDVRLGGIYALERLAQDSRRDHSTIMEVLTAFVRTHAPMSSCPPALVAEPIPPTDIQAALTVIGRRATEFDGPNQLDLSKTCLRGANLNNLDFSRTNLYDTDLGRALLWHTKLRSSTLSNTVLTSAVLIGADLTGAALWRTKFTSVELDSRTGGKITWNAVLKFVNLTRADVWGADFTGAELEGLDLTETRMREVVGFSR